MRGHEPLRKKKFICKNTEKYDRDRDNQVNRDRQTDRQTNRQIDT